MSEDDGGWVVRPVAGADARKAYRCPGCDHEITAGLPHLVVWRDDDLEERRHWHSPCWRARARRGMRSRKRRPGS